jgi:hypothetical protein
LFDLIEEPFDQVARSVKMRAEADRLAAIASLPKIKLSAETRFSGSRALLRLLR